MPSGNSSRELTDKEKVSYGITKPAATASSGGEATGVVNEAGPVSAAQIAADPYGKNSAGDTGATASFRQRGDVTQKRVGLDTRVRDDANSGTAGANGAKAGAMKDSMGVESQPTESASQQVMAQGIPQNAAWEATRQPVDINSVRSNLLSMLQTPTQQGQ